MNKPAATQDNVARVSRDEAVEMVAPSPARPTVLVATAEPSISASMRESASGISNQNDLGEGRE